MHGFSGSVSRDDQHHEVVRNEKRDLRNPIGALEVPDVGLGQVNAETANPNLHARDVRGGEHDARYDVAGVRRGAAQAEPRIWGGASGGNMRIVGVASGVGIVDGVGPGLGAPVGCTRGEGVAIGAGVGLGGVAPMPTRAAHSISEISGEATARIFT